MDNNDRERYGVDEIRLRGRILQNIRHWICCDTQDMYFFHCNKNLPQYEAADRIYP